jgi:hypothetical protein
MTLAKLREHLAKIPDQYLGYEVKVWLPGTLVSLSPMKMEPYHGNLLLEGNVDRGSALAENR